MLLLRLRPLCLDVSVSELETTAVRASAGPRGFVLCRAHGPLSFVLVRVGVTRRGVEGRCCYRNPKLIALAGPVTFSATGVLNLVSCSDTWQELLLSGKPPDSDIMIFCLK